jgi:hypothetical protein
MNILLTDIHQLIRMLDEGVWAGYGKKRRKSMEHGSSIPDQKSPDFRPTFCGFPPEIAGDHRKNQIRNTAFMFH